MLKNSGFAANASLLHEDRLLILDFGSQYAQLIARRVREMGVYCELMSADADEAAIREFAPKGIILSGGPETVTLEKTKRAPLIVFKLGCPVLGICYGMQTMALQLGGSVAKTNKAEFGYALFRISEHAPNKPNPLFDNIPFSKELKNRKKPSLDVWMSHGDIVSKVPPGFETVGVTASSPHAAIADFKRQFYGLQFHPEVTHTEKGREILKNFVLHICQCDKNWTIRHIIDNALEEIRETIGQDKVVIGLSGGVDSAVAAALMSRAIGKQLVCVLVDTGLLRSQEAKEIVNFFSNRMETSIIQVDARDRFIKALAGIADPEEKRRIIGEQFIRVFEEECEKIDAKWLCQGTIYPDVIESAKTETGSGEVIKTHHNVGGLPKDMKLSLIEPLRELFKDEVKELGKELGLPDDLIDRHPFPGPGLAVRVLGAIERDHLTILQQADAIFIEELKKEGLYYDIQQAFCVLIPSRSVGVKGDARHYGYVIALRAVHTIDFMTAKWVSLPYDFLSKVSHRIVNEVESVSRVVYDITNKPPATIEWE